METARWKAFLAAVDTGSLSSAAKALNYTPSGVSQLISALEHDLGFALLHRTNKGVSATSEGERLLAAIRSLLQQEERIYQLGAEIKGLSVGNITIATYSSMATCWLPQVIRAFQEDFPNIHIRLVENQRQTILQQLNDNQADLGFLSLQEDMPYDCIPLAEIPLIALLPKIHPLAEADSFPIARCTQEQFVACAFGHDDDIESFFKKHDIDPYIRFSTLENSASLAMIENGLCIRITNLLVAQSLPSFDVAVLPLDPPQRLTMGIAMPSLKHASPAVRKFTQYAVRILAPCGPQVKSIEPVCRPFLNETE